MGVKILLLFSTGLIWFYFSVAASVRLSEGRRDLDEERSFPGEQGLYE